MKSKYKILFYFSFYVISCSLYSMNLDPNRTLPYILPCDITKFLNILANSYKNPDDNNPQRKKRIEENLKLPFKSIKNIQSQQTYIDLVEICIVYLFNNPHAIINSNCPINKSETDHYFLSLDKLKSVLFLHISYDFEDKQIAAALCKKWLFERNKTSSSNNTFLIHNETKETEDFRLKTSVTELEFQYKNIIGILIVMFLIQGLTFIIIVKK